MSDIELELRELMRIYDERYKKLEAGRKEAKRDGDLDGEITAEAMQSQCRRMIADLFQTMKNLGILDEEEIEFGGIKNKL